MLVASSNTELGTSVQLRQLYSQAFSDLQANFLLQKHLLPGVDHQWPPTQVCFTAGRVLPPWDCVVQLIEFGTAAAGHQLESHRAECKNQQGQRSHWGLWLLSGVSRPPSGQVRDVGRFKSLMRPYSDSWLPSFI